MRAVSKRQAGGTLCIAGCCWLLSLTHTTEQGTSDPSIVDRLWSIMPWRYCWHWAAAADATSRPRVLLMALLSTELDRLVTRHFLGLEADTLGRLDDVERAAQ